MTSKNVRNRYAIYVLRNNEIKQRKDIHVITLSISKVTLYPRSKVILVFLLFIKKMLLIRIK